MTSATASDSTLPQLGGHYQFLLRRLHSLTGILIGFYVLFHLLVNATLAQSAALYQIEVNRIHTLPFLWSLEWLFIFLPLIFHTFYGLWIAFTGRPNVTSYPYGKNWYYLLQRISGIVLAFFITFHVFAMKGLLGSALSFSTADAARTTEHSINASWMVAYIVYPVGIIAACFHLANGFWTAAISWGLTISAASQRRWGAVCMVIFIAAIVAGGVALGATIVRGTMVVH